MPHDIAGAFSNLGSAITTRLGKKVNLAGTADNADKLGNATPESISATGASAVAAHAALKNNPHGVTAAQIGTLDKDQTAAAFGNGPNIPKLQYSCYGDITDGDIPYTTVGFTLSIGGVPAFIDGKKVVMGSFQASVSAYKKILVYLRVVAGVPTYVIEEKHVDDGTQVPESATNMIIGFFETNGVGFAGGDLFKTRRIGNNPVSKYGYAFAGYKAGSIGLMDSNRGHVGLIKNRHTVNRVVRGITIIAFNNGEPYRVGTFDTCGVFAANAALLAFVTDLPTGTDVLAYIWDEYSGNMSSDTTTAMGMIGLDTATFASRAKWRTAFLAFGKKGAAQGSVPVGYCGQGPYGTYTEGDPDSSVVVKFEHSNEKGFHNFEIVKAGTLMINF